METPRVVLFLGLLLMMGSASVQAQRLAPRPVLPDTTEPSLAFGFNAGLGLSSIDTPTGDSRRYMLVGLLPEATYGAWSGGLRLLLRVGADGVRQEDYDSFGDYLSVIRFVQYAEKGVPGYYARFGELEEARLGYGQHLQLYRNTISLDAPRWGFNVDHDSGHRVIEAVFGDVLQPSVFGLRGALRPYLGQTAARHERLTFGVSLAGDLDARSALVNLERSGLPFFTGTLPPGMDSLGLGQPDGRLFMLGADVGLPLRYNDTEEVIAFAEASKIMGHGIGLGIGLRGRRFLTNGHVEGWLEQRIMGPEYLPNYFNALYEVERIREVSITLPEGDAMRGIQTKRNQLAGKRGVDLGSSIGFVWRARPALRLQWNYEHIWNQGASGWFHVDLRIRANDLPFYTRLIFDRINVGTLSDIINGPAENGLLRLALAYQFWDYAMFGFNFRQSFEPVEVLGEVVGQRKRTRIEPLVLVVLNL